MPSHFRAIRRRNPDASRREGVPGQERRFPLNWPVPCDFADRAERRAAAVVCSGRGMGSSFCRITARLASNNSATI